MTLLQELYLALDEIEMKLQKLDPRSLVDSEIISELLAVKDQTQKSIIRLQVIEISKYTKKVA